MVSWSNLEKLCSCSRTWMLSALACGNKWIQVGTYTGQRDNDMGKGNSHMTTKSTPSAPKSQFNLDLKSRKNEICVC